MHKLNLIKKFLAATLLSVLVFFSISFITFLSQINPIHYYKSEEVYKFNIGSPFTYYAQFWVSGSSVPNSGWEINKLLYDCVLTWVVVTGLYFVAKRKKQ